MAAEPLDKWKVDSQLAHGIQLNKWRMVKAKAKERGKLIENLLKELQIYFDSKEWLIRV